MTSLNVVNSTGTSLPPCNLRFHYGTKLCHYHEWECKNCKAITMKGQSCWRTRDPAIIQCDSTEAIR